MYRYGAKQTKIMGFFDLFKKKTDTPQQELTPEVQAAERQAEEQHAEAQKEELAEGLQKTKTGFFSKLARAVAGSSAPGMVT